MIIDFHSHILPGVDHGSDGIEQTLSQLELVQGRVDRIVATSHFYPHEHNLDEFISSVDDAAALVKDRVASSGAPQICLGAEVLLCESLDRLDGVERLCIRGTRCMLLEMPNVGAWSSRLIDTVENLLDAGFDILLAHIDRYVRDYEEGIDKLLSMGAVAQINAGALTSFFSRRKLTPYIEGGFVYALGSDLHGVDKEAYHAFDMLEDKIGKNEFDRIMKMSELLLSNATTI